MPVESQPSINSVLSAVYGNDIESERDINEAKPSRSKTVVIEGVTPDEKVITYRKILIDEGAFQDPIPFQRYIWNRRKYSNEIGNTKGHLGDTLSKQFSEVLNRALPEVLSCEMTDEIASFLFVVSAYIIKHHFGKWGPESDSVDDLHQYIRRFLNISEKEGNESIRVVDRIKRPQFFLKLYLLEASGFTGIDNSRGLYCRAWISSDSQRVGMTSTAHETELPAWHHKFIFRIKTFETDVITIEMHDADRNFLEKNETNFSCVCCKDKDLIGTANVRVSDIYSQGIDEWIPLDCPRTELENIFLHIRVKFGVVPPKKHLSGLKAHVLLLRSCVEESMKNGPDQKDIVDWKSLLSSSALTLIFLHSVIACLSESEDIMCRFVVIINLGLKTESFSHQFLYYFLLETVKQLKRRESSCDFVDSNLELIYEKEMQNLINYCLKLISSLHDHNIVFKKRRLSEFEFAFKALHLCQNISSSDVAPFTMLKSEAVEWFEKKAETIMALTPDNRVSFLVEFFNYLRLYQQTLDKTFRKEFSDETYTVTVYKTLEDKLHEPLKFQIGEFSRLFSEVTDAEFDQDKVIEEGIEMFSKIRQLVVYISATLDVPATDLKLGTFQKWFGDSVFQKWYQYRQTKAVKEIENAVINDDLRLLNVSSSSDKHCKQSISAKQTCQIIEKSIKDLWLLISLPRSQEYDEMFMSVFHSCCVSYSVLVKDTVSTRKLFDEFFNEGRTHLCVLANNLWFVADFAEQTISNTIDFILPDNINASIILQNSCQEVCSSIINKYLVDIEILLQNIFKNQQGDLTEYSDYIKKIVWQEMFIASSFDVFVIILKNMTKGITSLLHTDQQEVKQDYSSKEKEFFSLLIEILTITKDVCSIPENPDENAIIWDEASANLLSDLKNKAS